MSDPAPATPETLHRRHAWRLFGWWSTTRRRFRQEEAALIARADAARGARDFKTAADIYSRVLAQDPTNAAIHIQCGHMNKEAGDLDAAEGHYLAARDLTPADADLHLQLGHFFKISGRKAEAAASYKKAADLLPDWPVPLAELAALRASAPSSVLMVDAFYPRPDSDSGSLDQIMFIKMFQSLGYTVAFAAHCEVNAETRYRDALQAMGVRCVVAPEPAAARDARIVSPAYDTIRAFMATHAAEIALCFLSRVDFGAHYLASVRELCPHARAIFNTVDLHYVREQREAELNGDDRARAKAGETRIAELHAATSADATIVVSDHEAVLLREAAPTATVCVIPLIRDYATGRRAAFADRAGIGFIGGFYHLPNVDAVRFFLDQVWPRVRVRLPEATFYVIGSNLPGELAARTDPGVTWVGHVPDLEPWLTRLRLTVAPLRYGAGAKGKVVSSLAYGVPCVVSPIAAEGMGLADGVHVDIGSLPEEFAERIVRLYTYPDRWLALSDAGIALVQQRYSFQHGIDLLQALTQALGMPAVEKF